MSIFNTRLTLTFDDVYDLNNINTLSFIGFDNPLYNQIEIYDLCSVILNDFIFFRNMSLKTFSNHLIDSFKKCELETNPFNLIKQLQINSDINEIGIDIIKNINIELDNYDLRYITYLETQTNKKYRFAIKFPSVTQSIVGHSDYKYVMLYIYENNILPKQLPCILFPLIPKNGHIDVFKSLE